MSGELGTSPGAVDNLAANNLMNGYANIPDVPVDASTDRIIPRQVSSGTTRGIQQLGSTQVYSDGGNNQIIVEDTVPRVLMGNQASFGLGLYVSKSGIDVKTNTDAAQFIFNSNQNVLKVVKTGTVVIPDPGAGNTSSVVVTHGLGFVPLVVGYAQGGLNVPLPVFNGWDATGVCLGITYFGVVNTNTLSITNFKPSTGAGSNIGQTVKYILYQESTLS
jgi:hypothetical protein